jgi:hypothetical protein
MQQARPRIKPAPNVPLVLQMETIQGVEVNSQFTGVEYRYYVVHENEPSTIYLPPEGRDAIIRAEPDLGDFIELLKQKTARGYIYHASRLSDAREEPGPPPPPARPPNGGGVRMLAGNRAPVAPVPRHPDNPDNSEYVRFMQSRQGTYAPSDQRVDWSDMPDVFAGEQRRIAPPPQRPAQPQAQAQPPRPEATGVHPIGQQLAGCFRAAVDAWEETRKYAQEKYGRELEYSTEDVRASGLSVFIGQQKRERGER